MPQTGNVSRFQFPKWAIIVLVIGLLVAVGVGLGLGLGLRRDTVKDADDCTSDTDCLPNELCSRSQKCVPMSSCGSNADCLSNSYCGSNAQCTRLGSCSSDGTCKYDYAICNKNTNICELRNECDYKQLQDIANKDCLLSETCRINGSRNPVGVCQINPCNLNGECPFEDQTCDAITQLCTRTQTCNIDADCPIDSECVDKKCSFLGTCKTRFDCPNPSIQDCTNKGLCKQSVKCSKPSDCPAGTSCGQADSSGIRRCVINDTCVERKNNLPDRFIENPSEVPSIEPVDCPSGYICYDNLCHFVTNCKTNSDCETVGEVCETGKGICVKLSDCTDYQVTPCPSNQTCVSYSNKKESYCQLTHCEEGNVCVSGTGSDSSPVPFGICTQAAGPCIIADKQKCASEGTPCPSDLICGTDNFCYQQGTCSEQGKTIAFNGKNYICNGTTWELFSNSCGTDNSCPEGFQCDKTQKICIKTGRCDSTSCPSGYLCGSDGICVRNAFNCTDDSGCPSYDGVKLVCYKNRCSLPTEFCESDSGCENLLGKGWTCPKIAASCQFCSEKATLPLLDRVQFMADNTIQTYNVPKPAYCNDLKDTSSWIGTKSSLPTSDINLQITSPPPDAPDKTLSGLGVAVPTSSLSYPKSEPTTLGPALLDHSLLVTTGYDVHSVLPDVIFNPFVNEEYARHITTKVESAKSSSNDFGALGVLTTTPSTPKPSTTFPYYIPNSPVTFYFEKPSSFEQDGSAIVVGRIAVVKEIPSPIVLGWLTLDNESIVTPSARNSTPTETPPPYTSFLQNNTVHTAAATGIRINKLRSDCFAYKVQKVGNAFTISFLNEPSFSTTTNINHLWHVDKVMTNRTTSANTILTAFAPIAQDYNEAQYSPSPLNPTMTKTQETNLSQQLTTAYYVQAAAIYSQRRPFTKPYTIPFNRITKHKFTSI